jgi:hypothetical protein
LDIYDAEFLEAFDWWLSEKAEWWLEHKKDGGPVSLADWAAALWKDGRVQAGWEVAAEIQTRLDNWKADQNEAKPSAVRPTNPTFVNFAKRFGSLMKEQSVPEDIPFAVAWEELEKKRKIPAHVKKIRGKLNVPRERFWTNSDGEYKTPKFT